VEKAKKIEDLLRSGLCTSIVTAFQAFQPHGAAALAVSEDVRVPGGVAAFARGLGVDPAPDRGRFMYEVTRIVHEAPEIRNPAVAAFLLALTRKDSKSKLAQSSRLAGMESGGRLSEAAVPVPLTSELWGSAVFHRRVAPDELAGIILADRQAALLCHGLASLDDPTLEYIAEHPALITRLYERSAPLFAAFSGSLSIRSNRVVPPGGADAAGLWEAAVNERVTRPDRFVTALFELYDGRLAYLYDTIGQLDPPHQAFVLGAWMSNATARREGFRAFVAAGVGATREWHARALPFGRQV